MITENGKKYNQQQEDGNIATTKALNPGHGGVDYSGPTKETQRSVPDKFTPYEPEQKESLLDKIKNKAGSFVSNQRAKAIENATPPETRYDLAGKTLEKANQEGLAANRAIQGAEVPKWKRMTFNDILFNPEYEGIRDSIASQAVNARGANFFKGIAGRDGDYTSAIDEYNKEQAQRYSDAIADRDTRALDAQLQAVEAANKRDVGAELQRQDTYLGRELDRWGLLYDTDTKQAVLKRMIDNSEEFAELVPNPEDRLMLTAYQQYLSGDATALDSLISTYGVEVLGKINGLVDTLTNAFGGNKDKPSINIGGVDFTQEQIENMGWDALDRYIQDQPLEEQKRIVEEYEKAGYKKADKLRSAYETRAGNKQKTDDYNAAKIKEADEKADSLDADITAILNGGYDEKRTRDKLRDLKTELERVEKVEKFEDTTKMKAARARLGQEVAKADLALEVKSINNPLQANVKLDIKGDVLNTKTTDSSLAYLSSLKWNELINKNTQSVTDRQQKLGAVMGTQGYKDVVNFLKNPKVQAYAYKGGAKAYKYAVDNFLKTFGGTAKDYGFLDVTW